MGLSYSEMNASVLEENFELESCINFMTTAKEKSSQQFS